MAINPLLLLYKGNRCRKCGETVEGVRNRYGINKGYLQFNHINPSKKHTKYKNLIRRPRLSPEQLNEVDKCELLCPNCHVIFHGQDCTGTMTLKVEVGGRVVEQELKCQVIVDLKDETLTVFPDGQLLSATFYMRRGNRKCEIITALELDDGRLLDYVMATREGGSFRLWDSEKRLSFLAVKKNRNECSVQFLVSFTKHSSLTFDEVDARGGTMVAIRRGLAICNNTVTDMGVWDGVWDYRRLPKVIREVRANKKAKAG